MPFSLLVKDYAYKKYSDKQLLQLFNDSEGHFEIVNSVSLKKR